MLRLTFVLLSFLIAMNLAHAQQSVNVKSFGALGDGMTDDTLAFEKAVLNLPDGGVLLIPQGRYVLGKTNATGLKITGKNNVTIVGENTQSQLLYYYSSYLSGDSNRNGALVVEDSKNVSILKLSILGMANIPNPSFSYSSQTNGIIIENSVGVRIEDSHVANMSGNGLMITSNRSSPSRSIVVKNSRFNQNRVSGVWVENVDGVKILDSEMNSNGQIGDPGTGYGFAGSARAKTGYPANLLVLNNEATRNVRKGLDVHAGVNISFINNSVFENGLYGIGKFQACCRIDLASLLKVFSLS